MSNTYSQRGRSFERSSRNYSGRARNIRRGTQSRSSGNFDNRTCYNCGVQGHISRFCPLKNNNLSSYAGARQNSIICYNCQQPGHMARDCMRANPSDQNWWRRPARGDVSTSSGPEPRVQAGLTRSPPILYVLKLVERKKNAWLTLVPE